MRNPILVLFRVMALLLALNACSLNANAPQSFGPVRETTFVPLQASVWEDASALMEGICFASAQDAAGRVFTLRGAEALTQFYDLADESGLCTRAVKRGEVNFEATPILTGGWSVGTGCAARHEVIALDYDASAATASMTVDFITEGECPYTLVRPFWAAWQVPAETEVTFVLNAGAD